MQDAQGIGDLKTMRLSHPALSSAWLRGRMGGILQRSYRGPDALVMTPDDRARAQMVSLLREGEGGGPSLNEVELSFELQTSLEQWAAAKAILEERQTALLARIEEQRKQVRSACTAAHGMGFGASMDPDFVFRGISEATISASQERDKREAQQALDRLCQELDETRQGQALARARTSVMNLLAEAGYLVADEGEEYR